MAGPSITLDFAYDGLNQVTSEAIISWTAYPGAVPLPVVGTARDGEGNLTSLTYPSPTPLSVTYVADDLNRLDEIQDGAGTTTLVDLTWSDLSQLSVLDFVASGAGDVYEYDLAGRIDVITHGYFDDQAAALSAVLDYTLDPTGAVSSIDDDEVTVLNPITYAYDDTKQLVRVDYPATHGSPDPVVQWEYDAAGNRLQEVLGTTPGVDPTTDYVPNALNQYAMVGPASRSFDANGNLTSDGSFTYHWDHENQLVEVRDATDTTPIQSYAYDPFGRRIRKTDPTNGDIFFVWSGDRLLEERDGSGDIATRYTYASGFAPVQVRYYDSGEVVYDVHADHLDTPRRLTDAAGEEVWRADHAAFGNAFEELDPDGDLVEVAFNIRFPGQYFDAETGLHYNRFRYYDPSIGRYISADPIGQAGGVNLYGYALSNPVNWFDPFGLLSYLVSRPTTPSAASHNFVVSNADYIGDPNATVHSFGQNSEGNVGNVGPGTNPSSFSADTYQSDLDYWKGLGSDPCVTDASTNPNLSAIPATDAAVDAAARGVVEDQDYSAISGPFGANSNSAAQAVADRAAGSAVPTPGGPRISPGAGSSGEIRFR